MIIDSLDEYIETVAGYIYDNDKVVTYKCLSKELEVHVNIAKQILWEFVQRHQKEGNIECTYLLIGTLSDGGTQVEVVKDVNLGPLKKKYSKIISEHIYSVQKTLPDIELLAISGEGDVKFSAIECAESIERTDEEMHVLRWGTTASNDIPLHPQEKLNPAIKSTVESETSGQSKAEKNIPDVKKTTSAHKKGFDSLFGKASNKQKSSATTEKSTSSTEVTSNAKQSSPKQGASTSPKKKVHKGGINSFFEQSKNQASLNKKPALSEERQIDNTIVQDEQSRKATTSDNKAKHKNQTRGKKRNRSKELTSTTMKRKRITVQSDSSDSEMSHGEEEEEDPLLPPSPQRVTSPKERSPSPPRVKHEGGKRKVLKIVDKTFEEDGYLVTKKVHVYESCSEDESEKVEIKKSSPPESRLESKAKKNRKQTTLMNFFKKS